MMNKRVVVIDYGMGNLHSVAKALEAMGAEVSVSSASADIESADQIVLPGVGSFDQGIKQLQRLKLVDLLTEQVKMKKKPFLGICLGMQLAAKTGYENGVNGGLGWIDAEVRRFDLDPAIFKVPHMGWDDVEFVGEDPLFRGLNTDSAFYFVHSYHFVPKDEKIVTSVCNYGTRFVASIIDENIHLVQFHPEKSQKNGLRLLSNFLAC